MESTLTVRNDLETEQRWIDLINAAESDVALYRIRRWLERDGIDTPAVREALAKRETIVSDPFYGTIGHMDVEDLR
jgi:cytidylate kinase